jgi:hypothetical protein
MARRETQDGETQDRSFRGRPSRPRTAAGTLPPSVLREVTGGEGEAYLKPTPPSPLPPDRG